MNATQCKMARGGLGWSAKELGEASGLGRMTVVRFERGEDVSEDSLQAMRRTFSKQGVGFIDRGNYKYGVYMSAPDL